MIPARRPQAMMLLRLVAAYVVLCGGFYALGAPLVQTLEPIFKAEIEALRPEYHVDRIRVDRASVHLVIHRTVPPRQVLRGSSASSFGFTYPILVLSLLAAWPFASRSRRQVAVGVAAALLLAVVLVDLPMLLLLTVAEVTEKREPFLLFLYYNGGRQLLALLIFAAALALSRRLTEPRPRAAPAVVPSRHALRVRGRVRARV